VVGGQDQLWCGSPSILGADCRLWGVNLAGRIRRPALATFSPQGRGVHRSATRLQSCFAIEKVAMCLLVTSAWLCVRRHVRGCRTGFAAMENFVAMGHSTLSGVRPIAPACCRCSEIGCVQMRITKVVVRRTDPPHKFTYAHGCSCDAAYVVPPLFSVRSFRSV
jgi:hypothetical protein